MLSIWSLLGSCPVKPTIEGFIFMPHAKPFECDQLVGHCLQCMVVTIMVVSFCFLFKKGNFCLNWWYSMLHVMAIEINLNSEKFEVCDDEISEIEMGGGEGLGWWGNTLMVNCIFYYFPYTFRVCLVGCKIIFMENDFPILHCLVK